MPGACPGIQAEGMKIVNVNGMAKLLSELLDPQLETGQYGVITEKRLREALTLGPPLDEREQSLLLLSPVVREDYRRIRQEIRSELSKKLEMNNVAMEIMPLAAASTGDKVVMKGKGFTVTLYRQEGLGVPWIILVQLGDAYMQTLNPMSILRLMDSGGLEWLRGRPDECGEITATWNDDQTDLIARSRRFSLRLEPA